MRNETVVTAIGVTEVVIALFALAGLFLPLWLPFPNKPVNVFVFVLLSAFLSFFTGLGVIRRRKWARLALVFFSGYVILTKMLIFSGLLFFSAEVAGFIPAPVKNLISVAYHSWIMLFFSRKPVSELFL